MFPASRSNIFLSFCQSAVCWKSKTRVDRALVHAHNKHTRASNSVTPSLSLSVELGCFVRGRNGSELASVAIRTRTSYRQAVSFDLGVALSLSPFHSLIPPCLPSLFASSSMFKPPKGAPARKLFPSGDWHEAAQPDGAPAH